MITLTGKLLKPRLLLLAFILVFIAISLLTYRHFGITIDETDTYLGGKLFYDKIRGNDPVLQKDFVIPQSTVGFSFYNLVYPAVLYVINDSQSYEQYHLLNLLVSSVIFILSFELLLSVTKKPLLSILGPFFLFLTPRFSGDIPANPKDIPFAIAYFASLAAIFFTKKIDGKIKLLILGFIFGIAQSQRIIGYSIYLVYFFWSLVNGEKKLTVIVELIIISLIGYLIHIVSMPYLGADPYNHFIDLIKSAKQFPWQGQVFFFGQHINATNIPWFYLPVWILISTPIFILVLFLFSLINHGKTNKLLDLFIISICTNILIFYLTRPVIYDGLRHMIFLIPQLVMVAVIGFIALIKQKKSLLKTTLICAVAVNAILVIIDCINLHPYQYVYFNQLVGGLNGASRQFETDYWAASYREAYMRFHDIVGVNNIKGKTIGVCGNGFAVEYYGRLDKIKVVTINNPQDVKKSDYIICWRRFNTYRTIPGTIIDTIKRQNTPLTYIIKRQ